MIAYDLQCSQGHRFEGWFKDRKAFEDQCKKKLVNCPVCDDSLVRQLPSTFAIKGTSPAVPAQRPQVDLARLGHELACYVEKNFDNVGADFAKEALKIHYGVSEPRNIRGVSTTQEEKTLRDEGVEFLKIPMPAPPSSSDTDS